MALAAVQVLQYLCWSKQQGTPTMKIQIKFFSKIVLDVFKHY